MLEENITPKLLENFLSYCAISDIEVITSTLELFLALSQASDKFCKMITNCQGSIQLLVNLLSLNIRSQPQRVLDAVIMRQPARNPNPQRQIRPIVQGRPNTIVRQNGPPRMNPQQNVQPIKIPNQQATGNAVPMRGHHVVAIRSNQNTGFRLPQALCLKQQQPQIVLDAHEFMPKK